MSLSLWGYLSHSITVAITDIDTIIPCQDDCNILLLSLTTSFLIFLQSFLYSAINGKTIKHYLSVQMAPPFTSK